MAPPLGQTFGAISRGPPRQTLAEGRTPPQSKQPPRWTGRAFRGVSIDPNLQIREKVGPILTPTSFPALSFLRPPSNHPVLGNAVSQLVLPCVPLPWRHGGKFGAAVRATPVPPWWSILVLLCVPPPCNHGGLSYFVVRGFLKFTTLATSRQPQMSAKGLSFPGPQHPFSPYPTFTPLLPHFYPTFA